MKLREIIGWITKWRCRDRRRISTEYNSKACN